MYISWCYIIVLSCLYHIHPCMGQIKNKGQGLTERVQQLNDMSMKKLVPKFNGAKFKEYVKSAPRNYSVIVMFTAMAPQRQCHICRSASEEFTIVASSFRLSPTYSQKIYFAAVDFDEGSDVFQLMRLNTAPIFMHFPSKGKPKNADTFDIQRVGYSAEALAKWIGERTDIQIRVFRPPNYSGPMLIILLFAFGAAILYLRRNLDFLYNKNIWAISAVCFCFAMVSGQMWNHIRNPPFYHRSDSGSIAYFHGSSQGQFVLETYIIIILNASIVLGMIMMTDAAVRKNGDIRIRQIMTVVGLLLVAVFYSVILSIFRSKAHGYPYSFLFK